MPTLHIAMKTESLDIAEASRALVEIHTSNKTSLKMELDNILFMEDMDWRQRYTCSKIKEGTQKIRYFHAISKIW